MEPPPRVAAPMVTSTFSTHKMHLIPSAGSFLYESNDGGWRLLVGENTFEIQPQVGQFVYSSGVNLDSLAELIVVAKEHAQANGINWSGNQ